MATYVKKGLPKTKRGFNVVKSRAWVKNMRRKGLSTAAESGDVHDCRVRYPSTTSALV